MPALSPPPPAELPVGDWLTVVRGESPLVVSIPHAGTAIPPAIARDLVSPWRARQDTDWWLDSLYATAAALGATVVHTALSRTVIDVNRDPSGASLYPGQPVTELCPTTTFDGAPLWRAGTEPDEAEIAERCVRWFLPYHRALAVECSRLRARHGRVVLYDAHSIRSRVPRLFDGTLPHWNIGTNRGVSCDPALTRALERCCAATGLSHVTDGRFTGGWITRDHGRPATGVHAVQMEIAMRTYLDEPDTPPGESNWPPPYDAARAAAAERWVASLLEACLGFAREG